MYVGAKNGVVHMICIFPLLPYSLPMMTHVLILAVLLAFDDRSAAQFWKFKSISLILGKFVAVVRICFLRCRQSYLVTCIWTLVSLDGSSGGRN